MRAVRYLQRARRHAFGRDRRNADAVAVDIDIRSARRIPVAVQNADIFDLGYNFTLIGHIPRIDGIDQNVVGIDRDHAARGYRRTHALFIDEVYARDLGGIDVFGVCTVDEHVIIDIHISAGFVAQPDPGNVHNAESIRLRDRIIIPVIRSDHPIDTRTKRCFKIVPACGDRIFIIRNAQIIRFIGALRSKVNRLSAGHFCPIIFITVDIGTKPKIRRVLREIHPNADSRRLSGIIRNNILLFRAKIQSGRRTTSLRIVKIDPQRMVSRTHIIIRDFYLSADIIRPKSHCKFAVGIIYVIIIFGSNNRPIFAFTVLKIPQNSRLLPYDDERLGKNFCIGL